MIIRPKIKVLINLFLLFGNNHLTKICGPLTFSLFFCTRPFDKELGSSWIYFFYLYTTIRPKFLVLLHLAFLLHTAIWQRIRILINLFLLSVHNHSTKICGPLTFSFFFCTRPFDKELGSSWIYFFYLYTTIRPKFLVLLHLAFLLHTAIWQRIRILINLFLLFVRNHSTKILSHHYS